MTDTTDFDGCNRECRKAGKHTLRWGGCEHAPKPEPTVSMSKIYTDPEDGYPSIGYDSYTVPQLADLIEPALRRVHARIGPNALATLHRGETVSLSGGEYADLAREAAHAIVHRNDPDAAVSAAVVPAADRAALRDRIVEALIRWTYRGQDPDPETGILDTVRANAYSRADAVLSVLPAPADRATVRTPAEPFPIWTVWREEQPAYGYFATEDIAKRASIDCWEEDEPSCPDYSWRPDGGPGGWELLVGDERAEVYIRRHLVWGGLPQPPRAAVLEEAADVLSKSANAHHRSTANRLRRMAAEAAAVPAVGVAADTTPAGDVPRLSEELCPGFPDRCPNLRTVEPVPGMHLGGVRCGCADQPGPVVPAQSGNDTNTP